MVVFLSNPFWAGSLRPPLCSARVCWWAGTLCCLAFQKGDAVDQCRCSILPGLPPALLRRKTMERMDVKHIVRKASANPLPKMFPFRP